MSGLRDFLRWASGALVAACLLTYVLSLPFYAGGGLGPDLIWRLEHARLRLEHRPGSAAGSFYVAPNSEGLRWRPDWRFSADGDWRLVLPLWVPLLGGLLVFSLSGLLRREPNVPR